MTTLQEGELRITLPETASGRSFDVPAHGLSHCMKAVDWIIELPDRHFAVCPLRAPDGCCNHNREELHWGDGVHARFALMRDIYP